ncbi:MAG: DNA-protecting protein DprA, partial [Proteobacteria bacterium]|nr:DNA-protecting protein DprA [Pseudomonadota bacterium]
MDNILPWISLKNVPGIGNHLFKKLIKHFKSPEAVFQASYEDLSSIDGISDRLAGVIKKYKAPEDLKNEIEDVLNKGYRIVTMSDRDYPPLLLEIPDPPP